MTYTLVVTKAEMREANERIPAMIESMEKALVSEDKSVRKHAYRQAEGVWMKASASHPDFRRLHELLVALWRAI